MSTSYHFHFLNTQVLLQHSPPSPGYNALTNAFKGGFQAPKEGSWSEIINWDMGEIYWSFYLYLFIWLFPYLSASHIWDILLQYIFQIFSAHVFPNFFGKTEQTGQNKRRKPTSSQAGRPYTLLSAEGNSHQTQLSRDFSSSWVSHSKAGKVQW